MGARADNMDTAPVAAAAPRAKGRRSMLEDLLQRKPYNAVTDFVDAPVARGLGEKDRFHRRERSLTYGELQERTCRFAAALQISGCDRRNGSRSSSTTPSIFRSHSGARCVPASWRCRSTRCSRPSNTPTFSPTAARPRWSSPRRLPRPSFRSSIGCRGCAQSYSSRRERRRPQRSSRPRRARFSESRRAASARRVRGADAVGRSRVLDVHLGLDRRTQGRQARPHHADGGGAADGPRVIGIREDDVVFSAAKLFFSYGMGNAMAFPMSVGATTVLLPQRPTPEAVFEVMRRHQPTIFYGVPTLYASLLAHKEMSRGAGSDRLRLVRLRRRGAAAPIWASAGARRRRRCARRHRLDRDVPDLSQQSARRRPLRHHRQGGSRLRPQDRR